MEEGCGLVLTMSALFVDLINNILVLDWKDVHNGTHRFVPIITRTGLYNFSCTATNTANVMDKRLVPKRIRRKQSERACGSAAARHDILLLKVSAEKRLS